MKLLISLLFFIYASTSAAQEKKLYNPNADAEKDIRTAVMKAKKEHKYVLIQGGGNWCKWCIEFARFAKADPQIDSMIQSSFVWYHLNYSKENENTAMFRKLDHAQRFGFPVFVILDEKGIRIHTQNSEYLKDGKKSYDKRKVMDFLKMWTPAALDAATYDK